MCTENLYNCVDTWQTVDLAQLRPLRIKCCVGNDSSLLYKYAPVLTLERLVFLYNSDPFKVHIEYCTGNNSN